MRPAGSSRRRRAWFSSAASLEPLGEIRQRAGKRVTAFAVEGDIDVRSIRSNTFEIEWPPRSEKMQKLSGNRSGRMVRAGCRAFEDYRRPTALARPARRACRSIRKEAGAMTDPFDLTRFVDAQAPVYQRVVAELGRGAKQSHWMWFIFPQLRRPRAQSDGATLCASLPRGSCRLSRTRHPGTRGFASARRSSTLWQGKTIREILGSPDDLKFRSSMTLFGAVSSDPQFAAAIDKYYGGEGDRRTLELLAR